MRQWLYCIIPIIGMLSIVSWGSGPATTDTGWIDQALLKAPRQEDYYTGRMHREILDSKTGTISHLVTLSTEGRVGEGFVCLFDASGRNRFSLKTAPIRDAGSISIGGKWFFYWREISASGTGLHAERVVLRILGEPDRSVWEREVRRIEYGPYSELLEIDVTLFTDCGELLDIETTCRSEQSENGQTREISREVKIRSYKWSWKNSILEAAELSKNDVIYSSEH